MKELKIVKLRAHNLHEGAFFRVQYIAGCPSFTGRSVCSGVQPYLLLKTWSFQEHHFGLHSSWFMCCTTFHSAMQNRKHSAHVSRCFQFLHRDCTCFAAEQFPSLSKLQLGAVVRPDFEQKLLFKLFDSVKWAPATFHLIISCHELLFNLNR